MLFCFRSKLEHSELQQTLYPQSKLINSVGLPQIIHLLFVDFDLTLSRVLNPYSTSLSKNFCLDEKILFSSSSNELYSSRSFLLAKNFSGFLIHLAENCVKCPALLIHMIIQADK